MQDKSSTGRRVGTTTGAAPWCSIGESETGIGLGGRTANSASTTWSSTSARRRAARPSSRSASAPRSAATRPARHRRSARARPVRRASTTSSSRRQRRLAGGREQGHQRPRLPDEPVVVRPDGRRMARRCDAVLAGGTGPLADPQRRPGLAIKAHCGRQHSSSQGRLRHADARPYCTRYQDFLNNSFARIPATPAACS